MTLKDCVYEVNDLGDLDDSTFQWLLQLSPSPWIRNGYYLLYKSKFNGDWVRLGKWYGFDCDKAYQDYRRELHRSTSGNLRIIQVDIKD
jgi:hypothetical protein